MLELFRIRKRKMAYVYLRIRKRKMAYFSFRIRNRKVAYFSFRIRITDTDTERSTVESVGILPIASRIRTHRTIQID